jgi:hypothetical protein
MMIRNGVVRKNVYFHQVDKKCMTKIFATHWMMAVWFDFNNRKISVLFTLIA